MNTLGGSRKHREGRPGEVVLRQRRGCTECRSRNTGAAYSKSEPKLCHARLHRREYFRERLFGLLSGTRTLTAGPLFLGAPKSISLAVLTDVLDHDVAARLDGTRLEAEALDPNVRRHAGCRGRTSGRGLQPTIEEPFSFEASVQGRDNQLERATRPRYGTTRGIKLARPDALTERIFAGQNCVVNEEGDPCPGNRRRNSLSGDSAVSHARGALCLFVTTVLAICKYRPPNGPWTG
jgi:hypothetical protein